MSKFSYLENMIESNAVTFDQVVFTLGTLALFVTDKEHMKTLNLLYKSALENRLGCDEMFDIDLDKTPPLFDGVYESSDIEEGADYKRPFYWQNGEAFIDVQATVPAQIHRWSFD
jgi:hypothetical protein